MNFTTSVRIDRLSDEEGGPITGYNADIKIDCSDCGIPFSFIGLARGYSPLEPMVGVGDTELRVPITPGTNIDPRLIEAKA